jgi:hypothetical protein
MLQPELRIILVARGRERLMLHGTREYMEFHKYNPNIAQLLKLNTTLYPHVLKLDHHKTNYHKTRNFKDKAYSALLSTSNLSHLFIMRLQSLFLLSSTLTILSATPTIRTQPHCASSATTATFDDRAVVLAEPILNRVGVYNGNFYQSFVLAQLETPLGIIPESGDIVIGAGSLVGQVLSGNPSINTATIDAFNLIELYFGCLVNDLNTVASVPVPCTMAITGIKRGDGSQRTTLNYVFQPENPFTSHMSRAEFSGEEWEDLMTVEFFLMPALTPAPATVLLLDNITYKNCSF